jgi:hypothetical protein
MDAVVETSVRATMREVEKEFLKGLTEERALEAVGFMLMLDRLHGPGTAKQVLSGNYTGEDSGGGEALRSHCLSGKNVRDNLCQVWGG